MKFKHGTRRRALEYEKFWVEKWKKDKTFEKSVENRSADNAFVFYDGPPFITGVPHHGTLLSSIVKDTIPRYQTMKGKRVERVWGWDCHGLPAEVFTEKKLGIKDRRDIGTKISLEDYITTARDNMVQTGSLWEDYVDRIGRWVDFKGAYKTMDKEYMESIWWAFKTLFEKGKIYEGERVLMYCTRDATPLSKAEVTMDPGAYQDVTDPSVYVKFKLKRTKKQAVAYYIENEAGEFTFVKRLADDDSLPNVWGLAAASLRGGETLEEAVKRGAKEKLGIDVEQVEFEGKKEISRIGYDLELSEYKITKFTGEVKLQGGSTHYANLQWSKDPAILKDAADRGSLCSRIFLENRNLDYDKKTQSGVHDSHLLAWTTTPWTLPANTAVGVGKNEAYAEVETAEGEHLILHKDLVEKVLTDEKHQQLEYKITRDDIKGKELIGLEYEPLLGVDRGENAHKVWEYPDLSAEEGSGIVHLAPAYGEEDFVLAQKLKIPVVHVIDENGLYTESDWKGENVWEANKPIAKKLHEDGVVWKIDYYRHSYPHCHRCGTRLMYRAHPSWFMNIDGQREEMLAQNTEVINWFPKHVKHGRFEKNILAAPDWNLSRDRFWATAMPVWEGIDKEGKKHQIVVGSYDELEELSGKRLEDYHRPWIDAVEFEKDGVHYKRIEKVLDGWFESGSMPFAQFHYPFENKEKFEANFPGDFIVEYVGQVRAWFYYLQAVNVGLFGQAPFKNVIVTGNLMGNDGYKLSKSRGNYTDPNEVMDKYSADAERLLLLGSPVMNAEDFSLQDKDVSDVSRKLAMIWNMYDFFTMYAEVDGWEYDGVLSDPVEDLKNPLDIWVVSRLHQLVAEVEKHMDEYNLPDAIAPILPFLDDASNWYVRRSRRRFWRQSTVASGEGGKSEDDGDKADAYKTLHYVLVRLAYLLAPFTPFLAEELYQNLTGDGESIHLKDWLSVGHINQLVMDDMDTVREYVNEGLSLRAKAQLKVRQPLASVTVLSLGEHVDFEPILLDELNVKAVRTGKEVAIDEKITPELRREGLMREVVRHVQSVRKAAGLNVDDRITLQLATENGQLQTAIEEHLETIKAETLANEAGEVGDGFAMAVKVEGEELVISLKKAGS
ncbi:MAG: class I tRNA ligase family protein [Candidatus Saccharimonadales bacterium]